MPGNGPIIHFPTEEEQQAAVAAAALNEPVAAGSIGPAPDEDPTKGTA